MKTTQTQLNIDESGASIKPFIEDMAVGDILVFPIERTISVRVTASTSGTILGRKFKTKTDRIGRTISVQRVR